MRTDRGGEGRAAEMEERSGAPVGPHGKEQGGEETSVKRDASQSACIVRALTGGAREQHTAGESR